MVSSIHNSTAQVAGSSPLRSTQSSAASSINFTQAVNQEMDAQLDKDLASAVHTFSNQGARTWRTGLAWRNMLGAEGKDLTSQMFRTWNTGNTEEGLYKFRTAHKESAILAEDTLAYVPERLTNMRNAINSLGGRLNSDYAAELRSKISNAESAIANLQGAVGSGGKIENITNKEEVTAALKDAESAMAALNDSFSTDNVTANINYSGKADWLQDGLGVNSHYLTAMGNHAEALGYSGVKGAATGLQTALKGYIDGDKSVSKSTITAAANNLENVLKRHNLGSTHDFDGMINTLLTADRAGLSDTQKATTLNDFNNAIYGTRAKLASEHAAAARADKTVQKSFEVQATATRAVVDRIHEKYNAVANSDTNLGELDELMEGVAQVAERLASGNSSNSDLHAIRALENIISARFKNIENITNPAENSLVTALRGESASYGNASIRPGLDDMPGNKRYIYAQLSYGGIDHFRNGIIKNIHATVSALDRLNSPSYIPYSSSQFSRPSSYDISSILSSQNLFGSQNPFGAQSFFGSQAQEYNIHFHNHYYT